MGVSRSASTVLAYAMKQQQWPLDYALAHVKERRHVIKPNEGFLKQLHTYSGILQASQQRHSALWKRRMSRELRKLENSREEGESEEEEESPDEQEYEEEEKEVFPDSTLPSAPQQSQPLTPFPHQDTPLINLQDSDTLLKSPSRSRRMNLFSLMQSICEQEEEKGRGSEREQLDATQRKSPAQRRRVQSQGRKGLIHQRAHVDVSPEPRSQPPCSSGAGGQNMAGLSLLGSSKEAGEKREGEGGCDGERMEEGKSG